jgi:hypothetical protein
MDARGTEIVELRIQLVELAIPGPPGAAGQVVAGLADIVWLTPNTLRMFWRGLPAELGRVEIELVEPARPH